MCLCYCKARPVTSDARELSVLVYHLPEWPVDYMQLLSLLRVSVLYLDTATYIIPFRQFILSVQYMSTSEPTTFFCDCDIRCQGERREVSRSTFYGHKKFRNPLSRFTPQFQEFTLGSSRSVLSSNPTQNTHSSGSSGYVDNSSSRINKRAHHSAFDRDHELGGVSSLHTNGVP
jgi:hypothetical protein